MKIAQVESGFVFLQRGGKILAEDRGSIDRRRRCGARIDVEVGDRLLGQFQRAVIDIRVVGVRRRREVVDKFFNIDRCGLRRRQRRFAQSKTGVKVRRYFLRQLKRGRVFRQMGADQRVIRFIKIIDREIPGFGGGFNDRRALIHMHGVIAAAGECRRRFIGQL